jgi:hypothetical protein
MAISTSTGAAITSPTDPRLKSRARFESSFVSFFAVHQAESGRLRQDAADRQRRCRRRALISCNTFDEAILAHVAIVPCSMARREAAFAVA